MSLACASVQARNSPALATQLFWKNGGAECSYSYLAPESFDDSRTASSNFTSGHSTMDRMNIDCHFWFCWWIECMYQLNTNGLNGSERFPQDNFIMKSDVHIYKVTWIIIAISHVCEPSKTPGKAQLKYTQLMSYSIRQYMCATQSQVVPLIWYQKHTTCSSTVISQLINLCRSDYSNHACITFVIQPQVLTMWPTLWHVTKAADGAISAPYVIADLHFNHKRRLCYNQKANPTETTDTKSHDKLCSKSC